MAKPNLSLVNPLLEKNELDALMTLYTQLTGKEPTPEGWQEAADMLQAASIADDTDWTGSAPGASPAPASTSSDVARLLDAIDFAADRHRGQRRKDAAATPYINHPLALARLLAVDGGIDDVEILMAAVLHDTIEDTATRADELRERFGDRVTSIVQEVTDDKTLPKAERKQLQIDHAPRMSREAGLVKLADKTCNLRDVASSPPQGWALDRRREYFDWAKRVIDGLQEPREVLYRAFSEAYARRP